MEWSSQVFLLTWGEVGSGSMFWFLLLTNFPCLSSVCLLRHVSILSLLFSTDPHYMLRIGFNCIQHFATRGELFCKQGSMFYCSGTLSLWIWFRNQIIHWKMLQQKWSPTILIFCLFYLVIVRLLAKLTPHSFNGSPSIKMKIDKEYPASALQVRACCGPTDSVEDFPSFDSFCLSKIQNILRYFYAKS